MADTVDPITVSVLQHRLNAIVEEMGEAMLRTSYSQILNSSRDFSTAICDLDGRLVAQAEHIPMHVGAMPWAAKALAEFFRRHPSGRRLPAERPLSRRQPPARPDRLRAGVRRATSLVFWSVDRAHHTDIGGATHGAYNPAATEIWHEGMRIPPMRLRPRRGAARPAGDAGDERAPSARFPRRPRGEDRLGACRRAAPAGARRRVRLGRRRTPRSRRCWTPPNARRAR